MRRERVWHNTYVRILPPTQPQICKWLNAPAKVLCVPSQGAMEQACCCVCRKKVPESRKRSLLFGWSERAGVLNNDRRTTKISVFPNPVGRDTKTSLPSQNTKIASSWWGLTFAKPSREAASRINTDKANFFRSSSLLRTLQCVYIINWHSFKCPSIPGH